MEILLRLTYVALCYAIFKLFRIPVNQWTLATAALGGHFRPFAIVRTNSDDRSTSRKRLKLQPI
jgi:hypothetical protein